MQPDSFPRDFQPQSSRPRSHTLPPPTRTPSREKTRIKLEATSYSFTREQILQILEAEVREQLGIADDKKVILSFNIQEVGGDPLDRFPGTKEVVGLNVNVS